MNQPPPSWTKDPESVQILVVDDDRLLHTMMRSTLHQLNHVTATYVDSLQAAKQAMELRPADVVFLDIDLGDASGLDLLEHFASQENKPFVVMLSANSTMENFKAAMEKGAGYFIVKPFTATKVREALLKYHAMHSPLEAEAEPPAVAPKQAGAEVALDAAQQSSSDADPAPGTAPD